MLFLIFQRRKREIKKTKTAPISQLVIPESPTESGETDSKVDYFTTLTDSQTLDRRTRNRTSIKTAPSSPALAIPHNVRPVYPMTKSVPEIREPVRQKQKKTRAFSRIAILSSYFEQKIAALSGSGNSQRKTGWKLPRFVKKKNRYR